MVIRSPGIMCDGHNNPYPLSRPHLIGLFLFPIYLMGGAYWSPPSDSSAFRVPFLEIRQPDIPPDPLSPS